MVAFKRNQRSPYTKFVISLIVGFALISLKDLSHWTQSYTTHPLVQVASSTTASDNSKQSSSSTDAALQKLLETRVCGSPAVDGYAHVNATCLVLSPTAQWWKEQKPTKEQLNVYIERFADYDGLAVRWGIDHKFSSVEECAEACKNHQPRSQANGGEGIETLPCNAFCYCTEEVCFEPDAHRHTKGDCWLKFTEAPASPEVNMRGHLPADIQTRHPTAPKVVPWHAGVVLPYRVDLKNGTWSPRYQWLL